MNEVKKGSRLLRILWGFFPWLIVIILVVLVVLFVGKIKEEKALIEAEKKAAIKDEVPAVKVITLTMVPERLRDTINLPAEIVPFEDLELKAEVPGQIINVLVKEGQDVEEGQLLVQLDDRDYVSRINQIKANYNLALQDYERISKLVERKIAAATQLDNLDARIKGLKAQLEEARLSLNRTKIKAPINGRINELMAKKGDWMGVAKPVAQILQYEEVKVSVGVPESDVASVFDLDKAEITIDALGGLKVMGKKYFLARQPRSLARLYDLELLIDNPDGRILPGMFARVELVKQVFEDALTIPLYSVISQGKENFVYIVNDSKAHKRHVVLGVLDQWEIQIKEGLDPGDQVVIVGHRMLDEGQRVEIIKNVEDPQEILQS